MEISLTLKELHIPEEEVKEKSDTFSSFLVSNTCTTAQDFEMKGLETPSAQKKGRQPKKTSTTKNNWYADLMNDKKQIFGEEDFAMALKETSPEAKGWFCQMEGAA